MMSIVLEAIAVYVAIVFVVLILIIGIPFGMSCFLQREGKL